MMFPFTIHAKLFTRVTLPILGGYAHMVAIPVLLIVMAIFLWKFRHVANVSKHVVLYSAISLLMYAISGLLHFFYWPDDWLRLWLYGLDIKILFAVAVVGFSIPSVYVCKNAKRYILGLCLTGSVGAVLPITMSYVTLVVFCCLALVGFVYLLKVHLSTMMSVIGIALLGCYLIGATINALDICSIPGIIDSNEIFHYWSLVGQTLYFWFLWRLFSSHATPS